VTDRLPHERVTVVVATRNRRDDLLRTVSRHVTLPEHPHVIVVDDASTDGSAAVVADAHPEVDSIRLASSRGCAARNVGARMASTPYIAFTDDDAWWRPGALARAAALLDAHPRLAVVQAHVLVGHDEHDDPTCAAMARTPLAPGERQPGFPILSFVACAVVVRRSAFLAAGGFCERFAIGGEEALVSWDLVSAGWQLSYLPEIVAHHDPRAASGGRRHRDELVVRNALWTSWLRRPAAAAMRDTAHALAAATRDRASRRGLARAIAGGAWVVRARRPSPMRVERMRKELARQAE
jgi:N-acetylglucosaminyl-diphospho-decaprenol L-rhamnosyltransferase